MFAVKYLLTDYEDESLREFLPTGFDELDVVVVVVWSFSILQLGCCVASFAVQHTWSLLLGDMSLKGMEPRHSTRTVSCRIHPHFSTAPLCSGKAVILSSTSLDFPFSRRYQLTAIVFEVLLHPPSKESAEKGVHFWYYPFAYLSSSPTVPLLLGDPWIQTSRLDTSGFLRAQKKLLSKTLVAFFNVYGSRFPQSVTATHLR